MDTIENSRNIAIAIGSLTQLYLSGSSGPARYWERNDQARALAAAGFEVFNLRH